MHLLHFATLPARCGQVCGQVADRFRSAPHGAAGKAEGRNCLIFRAISGTTPTACGQVDRVDRVFSVFICIFTPKPLHFLR